MPCRRLCSSQYSSPIRSFGWPVRNLWTGTGSGTRSFTGLANYRAVLSDPTFWIVVRNMVLWGAITIPVQMLIGGLLAYFIERHTHRLRRFFRTMYFLPVVTSVSVISLVWVQIYAPYYGIAQEYLRHVGITMVSSPIAEPRTAIYALILVNIWQWDWLFDADVHRRPGKPARRVLTRRASTGPPAGGWPSISLCRCWHRLRNRCFCSAFSDAPNLPDCPSDDWRRSEPCKRSVRDANL